MDLVTVDLDLAAAAGEGLEARARDARYRAFAERLAPREMLLTAHHADDQLETVLLRLFRGAGIKGLRGVLPSRTLGPGFVGRPFLDFGRAELEAAARAWGLGWVEDPSNRDRHLGPQLSTARDPAHDSRALAGRRAHGRAHGPADGRGAMAAR